MGCCVDHPIEEGAARSDQATGQAGPLITLMHWLVTKTALEAIDGLSMLDENEINSFKATC
jgi:hypothetical protein